MNQLTGPEGDWLTLGDQILPAAASTSLTVPTIASKFPGANAQGYTFVSRLTAQLQAYTVRFDGTAAVAGVTNGYIMNPADFLFVYGIGNINLIRFIQNAAGGSMAVTHYCFRPGPGAKV